MEKVVIESKLCSLADLLQKMKDILKAHDQNKVLQEYLLYGAEKKAEEIVELAISINQELLKSKGIIGRSYYESFLDLGKLGLFSEEERLWFAGTAGFRNRLAHEYLEVDLTVALRIMQKMGVMYPKYLQVIKKYVSGKK